jgi:hypothetical protein
MKITREEALVLSKLLHLHTGSALVVAEKSRFQELLEELSERLDDYILNGNEEEEDDEETEDDEEDQEDSSDEGGKEDDEEEDDCKDSSEKDDEEDNDLKCDGHVSASELHDLPPVRTSRHGSIEFEADEESTEESVMLLADGYQEHEVTHLRRKSGELHVRDVDGNWHVFRHPKFPKAWASVLPLDELIGVTA